MGPHDYIVGNRFLRRPTLIVRLTLAFCFVLTRGVLRAEGGAAPALNVSVAAAANLVSALELTIFATGRLVLWSTKPGFEMKSVADTMRHPANLQNSSSNPPTTIRTEAPRIPDHEVLRCIGKGSYGEVWLARSLTGSLRAAKVVRREDFEQEELA